MNEAKLLNMESVPEATSISICICSNPNCGPHIVFWNGEEMLAHASLSLDHRLSHRIASMTQIRHRWRPDGTIAFYNVYRYDVGSAHCIARLLWLELHKIPYRPWFEHGHWMFSPADWGRR